MAKTGTKERKDSDSAADGRASAYVTGHCSSGDCRRCNGAEGKCSHDCHQVDRVHEELFEDCGCPRGEPHTCIDDEISGGGDSEDGHERAVASEARCCIYCTHNAERRCECQPCTFIRREFGEDFHKENR